MPRMNILNKSEQETFDTPPVFNSAERKRFFNLPQSLRNKAKSFRKSSTIIGFFLTCGYFKATKRFFRPEDYHQNDVTYIVNMLNLTSDQFIREDYVKSTRVWHQNIIRTFYGYKRFDQQSLEMIKMEITSMVRSNLKSKLIFWRCIDVLIRKHVQIPSYFQLAELIVTSLRRRKKELIYLIRQQLTDSTRVLLESLFNQQTEGRYARYKLTLLKKLSQSTKPTQIKERTADLLYMAELYKNVESLLQGLDLGYEGIRYFAHSVIKSDIFQLNQRIQEDRYVHVVAFITHQYYRLQDNLVDSLLVTVRTFENSAKRDHKDRCYEQHKTQHQSLKILVASMEKTIFEFVRQIGDVVNSDKADFEKLEAIKKLLNLRQADLSTIEEQWQAFKSGLDTDINDPFYNDILEKRSLSLQNRVSPILKALTFQGDAGTKELMHALHHFKKTQGVIKNNAPTGFLHSTEMEAVMKNGVLRPSLYKAFLFMHVANAIKSGQLNLEHSYKYRSLDAYMISKARWKQEKQDLIIRADLKKFEDCGKVLQQLDQCLQKQYQKTNDHICKNRNPYFKAKKHNGFTLSTPKQEDETVDLLRSYFPDRHFVPLPEILSTVNGHTEFLQEFQHWQQRYAKGRTDDKVLYAGIVGLGCSIGIAKMSRISKFINENTLQNAVNWYFSLDNIRAANDCIVRFMDRMDLPNFYRQNQDTLHTSSDGQKFEVRTDSLNANYSFKYFGKGQGITANTFIDERGLLWYSLVFSAAERESAYVIDGLMHNDVIKSDIHSTDTHGYSEAIFATTYLLGFSYAPRIKNLKKQTLYIFKSAKDHHYADRPVKATKYVNLVAIESCWDDILRLVTTIRLKETSASEIFRRLNSYSKQHTLYHALKAFGQIIKSDFILRYIDDVALRQAIEKQLNKVELANRFTRAIAVGNPREFTQGEKEEQEIAESCNRLIKNAIICWNYLYLSQKLEKMTEKQEKEKLLSAMVSHSPMSWAHTNLLGEYDFSDEKLQDSVGIALPKKRA